ncbi:hypothetical protein [Martelella soudanensis]|uniref:hypothetical protein n=1 Tax=unclassified Martelella TaxID=2629616 RepID=UPI0015DF1A26|nr:MULTISPECIES: hypothetical protein [unclassified Martelella]
MIGGEPIIQNSSVCRPVNRVARQALYDLGLAARPLQDKSVEAINRNLGLHAAVDPHLRRAAALMPEVNIRDDRINPYPGRAILMIAIFGYLVWAGWLFVRPEREGES